MRLSLSCAMMLQLLAAGAATTAAAAATVRDPPHPTPVPMECGLQLYCTPDAPCMQQQDQYTLVTFDLTPLRLNFTANNATTDYSVLSSDGTSTYYSNVCAPTKKSCAAPHLASNNWGIQTETSNPGPNCFPLGHQQLDPPGYELVNPLDVTAGLQVRYFGGESDGCDGGLGNPRQVLFQFLCSTVPTPNPLVAASFWPSNSCNYTLIFSSPAACPVIVSYGFPSPPPSAPKSGLSAGSIFCIVLLVSIVLYVAISMAFNYSRGARTLAELKPHPWFWAQLAALVADGCRFSVWIVRSRCTKSGREQRAAAEGYTDMDKADTQGSMYGSNAAPALRPQQHAQPPSQARRGSALPPLGTPASDGGAVEVLYDDDASGAATPVAAKTNYAAHFAADRDEIGGGRPLARQEAMPYEAFPDAADNEEAEIAAASAAAAAKKNKKKAQR